MHRVGGFTITPPLCRFCRGRHDPALVCVVDDGLRLFTPYRTAFQDEADGLEALRVARYAARRPAAPTRRLSPPLAAAAVLAALALCMLLLTVVAAALH